MRVSARDAIMVGDRMHDVIGAREWEMPCIGLYSGAACPEARGQAPSPPATPWRSLGTCLACKLLLAPARLAFSLPAVRYRTASHGIQAASWVR